MNWDQFLSWVNEDPEDRLDLPEDLDLEVGQLFLAYPPFCTKEGENAEIRAINGKEVIAFHADFAKQISSLDDGQQLNVEVTE